MGSARACGSGRQVLKALEDNDIEDVQDLKHLAPADVKDLGLSVLHTNLVTKLLSQLNVRLPLTVERLPTAGQRSASLSVEGR